MEDFYQHLNKFRLEGTFCDVNLWAKFANNSENVMGPFPAHKVILAASCPTLSTIMTSQNIALDAADSETLPVLLAWVYGQKKKATDLIKTTVILKRVIYLAKCLGMRPFVGYLEKLESSLLPDQCIAAAANALSRSLETTPSPAQTTLSPAPQPQLSDAEDDAEADEYQDSTPGAKRPGFRQESPSTSTAESTKQTNNNNTTPPRSSPKRKTPSGEEVLSPSRTSPPQMENDLTEPFLTKVVTPRQNETPPESDGENVSAAEEPKEAKVDEEEEKPSQKNTSAVTESKAVGGRRRRSRAELETPPLSVPGAPPAKKTRQTSRNTPARTEGETVEETKKGTRQSKNALVKTEPEPAVSPVGRGRASSRGANLPEKNEVDSVGQASVVSSASRVRPSSRVANSTQKNEPNSMGQEPVLSPVGRGRASSRAANSVEERELDSEGQEPVLSSVGRGRSSSRATSSVEKSRSPSSGKTTPVDCKEETPVKLESSPPSPEEGDKLKIPKDTIKMPYKEVSEAKSMMTCYCHLCGKMKPGNQLKLHYEKSHDFDLKDSFQVFCLIEKAEDFLEKCKWVALKDLTAEMCPDLVCGVCYLNKSGKKNLFKHLKEKHLVEVDEDDPEYLILVEKKMWEMDVDAVAGKDLPSVESQTMWVSYAEAPNQGSYQCHDCQKPMGYKKSLKQHLLSAHEIHLNEDKDKILQVIQHRESSRKRKSTLATRGHEFVS